MINKRVFHWSSSYWSNMNEYNPLGGRSGFDHQETKLRSYWGTPFRRICLGMKYGGVSRWISINQNARSLHSLIADGRYRPTHVGRERWRSLIGGASSLQPYCNREGFNTQAENPPAAKARIGLIANDRDSPVCRSCDSFIGFGTSRVVQPMDKKLRKHGNFHSCTDIENKAKYFTCIPTSKAYTLMVGGRKFQAYCYFRYIRGCGAGPWTMVMKLNGNSRVFHWSSSYWSNKNEYNPIGGISGFDNQETKLRSYWGTPFSRICLGMKYGGATRWIVINQSARSLHSLIADGRYRPTNVGREISHRKCLLSSAI
ncbi:hypothetical protein QZH41_010709, partial [Actinostola sp. cb2023]